MAVHPGLGLLVDQAIAGQQRLESWQATAATATGAAAAGERSWVAGSGFDGGAYALVGDLSAVADKHRLSPQPWTARHQRDRIG